jgi:hypothetical protein
MAKCSKKPGSDCTGPACCSKKHVELQITAMHYGAGDVQESFCVSHWSPEQFDRLRSFLDSNSKNPVSDLIDEKRTDIVIPSFVSKLVKLKPHLKAVALLWSQGYDLFSILPCTTYYRIKKQLLSHGIDITSGGANVTA